MLGNGTCTLIPGCVRACAEEAMAGPLLQESRVRSPNTIPQAMSTFPSISSEDMTTMQRDDEAIGRLWYYWVRKHPPTLRQLMKEPKPARRLLREWKRVKQGNGVLYRVVQVNGQEVRQLILPGSLKDKVLRSVHDDLGHQAVEKTTSRTRGGCYLPEMVTDIAE